MNVSSKIYVFYEGVFAGGAIFRQIVSKRKEAIIPAPYKVYSMSPMYHSEKSGN